MTLQTGKTILNIANDNTVNPGDECWYRCIDYNETSSGGIDMSGNVLRGSGRTVVQLRKLKVAHHTPKGVRLFKDKYGGETRVVLHSTQKKFAHADSGDAIDDFIQRKNRQLWILRNQVRQATDALALVAIGDIKT